MKKLRPNLEESYHVKVNLFMIMISMPSSSKGLIQLTWSTTWCAIRPLFCRILKSVAPLALAIFFATGYVNKGAELARSFQGPWGLDPRKTPGTSKFAA